MQRHSIGAFSATRGNFSNRNSKYEILAQHLSHRFKLSPKLVRDARCHTSLAITYSDYPILVNLFRPDLAPSMFPRDKKGSADWLRARV